MHGTAVTIDTLEDKVVKGDVRAVFCYLANSGVRSYVRLLISLFLLNKNFLKRHKYDVIIFHEANYSNIMRAVLGFCLM